jgi:hypothetical protein
MQTLTNSNWYDEKNNPTGGSSVAVGIRINWQDGVLKEGETQNGALIEEVVEAVIQRLRFYQSANEGKFACRENALAITHLEEAQHWMWRRTKNRVARGVANTYDK